MPIVSSLQDGVKRVLRAPAILAGAGLLAFALVLPLNLLYQPSGSDGSSNISTGSASSRVRECAGPAIGVDRSLGATMSGCVGLLTLVTVGSTDPTTQFLTGYLLVGIFVLWTFVSGGILDRYARDRPTRTAGFFSACGVYGTRLLRLACLATIAYGVLFGLVQRWLFDDLYLLVVSGTTVTSLASSAEAVLYCVFGFLVITTSLIFDYARVRAVVEDRHSMAGSLIAGWRFVRRRPGACTGLFAANTIILLMVTSADSVIPRGDPTVSVVLLSLGYLVTRLAGRLLFYSTEISYFQSQLAHAGYVARPAPVWPESPSAEALGRLRDSTS